MHHDVSQEPGPGTGLTADDRTRAALLTPRERQVLAAITRGLTNDGIAVELRLSTRTVRNYVSRAYAKIGAQNRVEALLWWARVRDDVEERV